MSARDPTRHADGLKERHRVPELPLEKHDDYLIYLPPVAGSEPAQQFATLVLRYGDFDDMPDHEVYWRIPLNSRVTGH
jgi:hypothetical protein